MNQLPPQAYTRDMLALAYEWLQRQAPSIREMATSSDSLVALYLQSRRRSAPAASAEGTPSAEAFKNDLKNLAEGLKQFDGPITSGSQPTMAQVMATPISTPPRPPIMMPELPPNMVTPQTAQQASVPHVSPQLPHMINPMDFIPSEETLALDNRSIEIIRRVQARMNLSSEKEALRLLLALGYDRVREILPKG